MKKLILILFFASPLLASSLRGPRKVYPVKFIDNKSDTINAVIVATDTLTADSLVNQYANENNFISYIIEAEIPGDTTKATGNYLIFPF